MADRVYILCPFAGESSLYTSWLDRLTVPYTIEHDPAVLWEPPADAGLVVTHMHYRWEDLSVLRRLTTEHPKLPVLVLADGILEYRNVWQHPGLVAGSMFQPLMGHKIACIGRAQARILESWGNVGKCEVVGLPRLDSVVAVKNKKKPKSDKFRLLIATAQTPSFDDTQYQTVVKSLRDLQGWLNNNPKVDGREVEATWRLTAGLDQEIGLPQHDDEVDGQLPPMLDVLADADAVITTPSTVYLESVIKGLPTAILDYHNTPAYVPPAWTISAENQIGQVITELADPPLPKMMFQETTLHDNLECRSPASDRLIELIQSMIECGNKAAVSDSELEYPFRIVADPSKGFFHVLETFEIERLFPNVETFQNHDLRALQVELNAARECLDPLPKQLADCELDLINFKELLDECRAGRKENFDNFKDLKARFVKLKARLETLQKNRPANPDKGGKGNQGSK